MLRVSYFRQTPLGENACISALLRDIAGQPATCIGFGLGARPKLSVHAAPSQVGDSEPGPMTVVLNIRNLYKCLIRQ